MAWDDGSSLSTSFTVLQSTDGTTFTPVATVTPDGSGSITDVYDGRYNGATTPGSTATQVFSGLIPGTQYDVMLVSTTAPPPSPPYPDGQPYQYVEGSWQHQYPVATTGAETPASPQYARGMYDASVPHGRNKISWTNTSNNEDEFVIYRNGPGDPQHFVGMTEADDTSYVDTNLVGNGPWNYTIYARNDNRQSPLGATVTISAIGGTDITSHLLRIRQQLLQSFSTAAMSQTQIVSFYNYLVNYIPDPGKAGFWDIEDLFDHSVVTSTNSGVLPTGGYSKLANKTVTVSGRVYYDDQVNYWLFGSLAEALVLRLDAGQGIDLITQMQLEIKEHDIQTGTNEFTPKKDWFDCGLTGNFNPASQDAIPGVQPAPPREFNKSMKWQVGNSQTGIVFGSN